MVRRVFVKKVAFKLNTERCAHLSGWDGEEGAISGRLAPKGRGLERAGECGECSGNQTQRENQEGESWLEKQSLDDRQGDLGPRGDSECGLRQKAVVDQRLGIRSLGKAGFGSEAHGQQVRAAGTRPVFSFIMRP